MPRKAKLKDEENKRAQEIKETKPELTQEEINSLEQMIEENSSQINSSELREFLRGDNLDIALSSPSLKKVNPPQQNQIMLERDIITGNTFISNSNKNEDNKKNNGINYIPEVQDINQPKYVQYGERVGEMVRIRETDRPKIVSPFERKEMVMNGSMKTTPDIENFEKYTSMASPVRKSEKEKFLKRDPFERKEVKYTPEKY